VGQFELLAPLIWPFICATLFSTMPKRSSNDSDSTKNALRVVETATGGPLTAKARKRRKNPHAVALGRKGGKVGGAARAANLTPEQRSQIAKVAAAARWKQK
jgi:Spy/CpxP family protein refolding chaperone